MKTNRSTISFAAVQRQVVVVLPSGKVKNNHTFGRLIINGYKPDHCGVVPELISDDQCWVSYF